MAIEFTKSEAKDWAKQNLKGLETVIFPSFTPGLEILDEEGIRYDVNHIIANGFTSIMVSPESCGMTFEERKKLVEIVCDEARGKVHTSVAVMQQYSHISSASFPCHLLQNPISPRVFLHKPVPCEAHHSPMSLLHLLTGA